jgi:hypothetical protein
MAFVMRSADAHNPFDFEDALSVTPFHPMPLQ